MKCAEALLRGLLLLLACGGSAAAQHPACHGRFANPVTDLCWRCIFPLTVGAVPILPNGAEDTANPASPACWCTDPYKAGLHVGFWEPARMVDVTRTPFCMVGLGGIALDPGFAAPRGAHVLHDSQAGTSFYQVHWYTNPVLYWLGVLGGFPCLEKGALDVAWLSEFDPLWNDGELSAILHPEAVLFANLPAQAACAADCVAASAGFALSELFWCAGCQGSVYPMTGHATTHVGAVQASVLLTQRITAKMHRLALTKDGAGPAGVCEYYVRPLMDKRHYKTQMLYPVPSTSWLPGSCCHPFGRTTLLWGSGKSFPVAGEDFAYQLFRKRNCCASFY